jgi:LysM repeat protein
MRPIFRTIGTVSLLGLVSLSLAVFSFADGGDDPVIIIANQSGGGRAPTAVAQNPAVNSNQALLPASNPQQSAVTFSDFGVDYYFILRGANGFVDQGSVWPVIKSPSMGGPLTRQYAPGEYIYELFREDGIIEQGKFVLGLGQRIVVGSAKPLFGNPANVVGNAVNVNKNSLQNSTLSQYAVQKGDTFSSIAAKFGVDVRVLFAANPQLAHRFSMIYVGDLVNIPGLHNNLPVQLASDPVPQPPVAPIVAASVAPTAIPQQVNVISNSNAAVVPVVNNVAIQNNGTVTFTDFDVDYHYKVYRADGFYAEGMVWPASRYGAQGGSKIESYPAGSYTFLLEREDGKQQKGAFTLHAGEAISINGTTGTLSAVVPAAPAAPVVATTALRVLQTAGAEQCGYGQVGGTNNADPALDRLQGGITIREVTAKRNERVSGNDVCFTFSVLFSGQSRPYSLVVNGQSSAFRGPHLVSRLDGEFGYLDFDVLATCGQSYTLNLTVTGNSGSTTQTIQQLIPCP